MTKAEFAEQFKRLRVAGYRLPVFDGVTVKDVTDEWYGTFGSCSVQELAHAIDQLKRTKTDTFWPASGELWAHIYQYRKERRIRRQSENVEGEWHMSETDAQEFLSMLRATRDKIIGRMAMPKAAVQVDPDHVLLEQEQLDRAEESNG